MTDHASANAYGYAAFLAHLERDSSLDPTFQEYLCTKRDPDAVSAAWLAWLQGWDAAKANSPKSSATGLLSPRHREVIL